MTIANWLLLVNCLFFVSCFLGFCANREKTVDKSDVGFWTYCALLATANFILGLTDLVPICLQ